MRKVSDPEVKQALASADPKDKKALYSALSRVGLLEVKKALTDAEGDPHKAVYLLEERGYSESVTPSESERSHDQNFHPLPDPESERAGEPDAEEDSSSPYVAQGSEASARNLKGIRGLGVFFLSVGASLLFAILISMAVDGDVVPLVAAIVTPLICTAALLSLRRVYCRRAARLQSDRSIP